MATQHYDTDALKVAVGNRWVDILSQVGGLPLKYLGRSNQAMECPKCKGKDRYRFAWPETGGTFCNRCHCDENSDGIAAIKWLLDCSFHEACDKISEFIGYHHPAQGPGPGKNKGPVDPTKDLEFLTWNPNMVRHWCNAKKPISQEGIVAAGGQLAQYRKNQKVIAFPVFNLSQNNDAVGWSIYDCLGGMIPTGWDAARKVWTGEVKCKLTYGSQPGMMGHSGLICLTDPNRRKQAKTVWLVEGATDLCSLLSMTLTAQSIVENPVLSSATGAGWPPPPWLIDLLKGLHVVIIRDRDYAGRDSNVVWASALVKSARQVRVLDLPFEMIESHGQDLRDWFATVGDVDDFFEMVRAASIFQPEDTEVLPPIVKEAVDNSRRLARCFLNSIKEPGSVLWPIKYWSGEWWRWDGRKYVSLNVKEMRADVVQAIWNEFDKAAIEDLAAYEKKKDGKDKGPPEVLDAKTSIISNTMIALESFSMLRGSDAKPGVWLSKKNKSEVRPYVAMENGIVNLDKLIALRKSGGTDTSTVMRQHSPRWFSPVCLVYNLDMKATCPRWEKVIEICMENDQQRIDLLQEWAGYCLTPSTQEQRFMIVEGEGGNGKSVWCAGLEAILGPPNVSHVALENFGSRFSLSTSLGKLANIVAECGELDKVAEGVLKQFTGGDVMQFEKKHVQAVEATPTARFMLATNNRPRFSDKTSALWRRLLLVPFNHTITKDEKIKGMDSIEWWQRSGELPGMLNWALDGLLRLKRNEDFTEPLVSRAATEEYKIENDTALDFLLDCTALASERSVRSTDLYTAYMKWCKEFGHMAQGHQVFGKVLSRKFPSVSKHRGQDAGQRFNRYEGIYLIVEDYINRGAQQESFLQS